MSPEDEHREQPARWVELLRAADPMLIHSVRAGLQSRGVEVTVLGEHHAAVLGYLHGGAVPARVMVREDQRALARRLAAEIAGPFDDEEDDVEDTAFAPEDSPHRRMLGGGEDPEELPEQDAATGPLAGSGTVGDSALWSEAHAGGLTEAARGRAADGDDDLETPSVRVPRIIVVFLIAMTGLCWGLGHLYVGRRATAQVLFAIAIAGAIATVLRSPVGVLMLAAVYVIDFSGAVIVAVGATRDAKALPAAPRREPPAGR